MINKSSHSVIKPQSRPQLAKPLMYYALVMGQKSASFRGGALILAALSGGGAIGLVLGGISAFTYLAIVMPIVGALACGACLAIGVRWFRTPMPRLSMVAGLVAGSALMIALLAVSLANERAAIVYAVETSQGVSEETIERVLHEEMNARTGGRDGVFSALWLRVHSGIRITPTLQFDATPIGNALILALEWVLAMMIVVRVLVARAREPFCEACGDWYTRRLLGTAPLGSLQTIRSTLQDGQFHRLGRRLDPSTKVQALTVHSHFCLQCDTQPVVLELEVREPGAKANIVVSVTAPYEALDDVLDSQALASGQLGAVAEP
jgi:hypothetical protein